MFLADYHSHSNFSFDGHDSLAGMLAAAQRAGLDELCVTDHCDIGREEQFLPEERYEAFAEARSQGKARCKLLLGIELGEPVNDYQKAGAAVDAVPYDFIIGSHHALRGEEDFYWKRFDSEDDFHRLMPRYFAELREMAEWGRFDVLGHIDYPLRYTGRDGFVVPSLLPRYEDELRGLFTLFAQKGIGMEMNLSPRVDRTSPAVYALFRQCGGEIVTLGSDAHRADEVGHGIKDGTELARAAGFEYIAAFEQRKVRYEKI
jgi:histidinol-phosphatase (PHP family)